MAILFLAEEPRKQFGLNLTFLQRRIAQGRYFGVTLTFINISGMFLLLLIGTNISNRWINIFIKNQKRVDLYVEFCSKSCLGVCCHNVLYLFYFLK